MHIACLDLEGVLVPEIWINVAERTGIAELRRTTRDEPDYDMLMRQRLAILARARASACPTSRRVIAACALPEGAREFLDWLRERLQVVILSDTFDEFAAPLMRQLGWPTLFCHRLESTPAGRITGYRLRLPDQKRAGGEGVPRAALPRDRGRRLLQRHRDAPEADAGILFRPPDNVIASSRSSR